MKGRPSRLPFALSFARALSIAGHPLILILVTVAAATRNWVWTAVLAAATILPLTAIIIRNVRRGSWTDFDVSRPDQRPGLYRAAIPLVLLTTIILFVMGAGPGLLRGFAAGVVMLLVAGIGNRYLKISMHMMAAAFCAVTLGRLYPSSPFVTIPFVILLGWSRHTLERHTWVEILVGVMTGAAAALLAAMQEVER